jgi:hypothetical protein
MRGDFSSTQETLSHTKELDGSLDTSASIALVGLYYS